MKSDRRYVFDTNVIVSALLFRQSKPAQAFHFALDDRVILLSMPVLRELSEVLGRSKFDRYILPSERERFLLALVTEAVFVPITEHLYVCVDPRDNKFLDLAVNGSAKCIITGDEDLSKLNPFRGIPIISADSFLSSWRQLQP